MARIFTRRRVRWILAVTILVLVGLQFTGPARTNPPFDQEQSLHRVTAVPPAVSAILARSCNDCHSNETRWPWYAYVAPVSWFTVPHVDEGRAELNFSQWGRYGTRMKETRLRAISAQCAGGTMPLSSYVIMHGEAALLPADVTTIREWAAQEERRLKGAGFDPRRDAAKDVESAIELAKRENKRVLIDVGENACGWCRNLSETFEKNEAAARILRESYVVVMVNVSREAPNSEWLSRYPDIPGYPHLFVLDRSGAVLESQRTLLLHDGDHHDPAKVVAFLKKWEPGP